MLILSCGTFCFARAEISPQDPNNIGIAAGSEAPIVMAGSGACDINSDGGVNVLDLQSLANAVLGIQSLAGQGDLNADGSVNVLDIQVLVNVILGTASCPQPTQLSIVITAPASGATLSSPNLGITANVTGSGIAGVQFKLDGTNLGAEDTTSPYSISWNTTSATNGNHTLTAVVRDSSGNQVTSSAISVTTYGAPPGNPSGWVLNFSDEFDGTSLDLTKWNKTYPNGGRTNNDELEWYVDNAQTVSNGTLKLVAKHESAHSGYPYTSGMICSYNKFSQTYGYFEARMKIPAGQGLWPAFWLVPTPSVWPPEIDVMENLGNDPSLIYMTSHYSANYPSPGEPYGGSYQGTYGGTNFSTGFHRFGVEWSSTAIVWYVDGVERYRVTQRVPILGYGFTGMYMIANLAVGGSWPGNPDASLFPTQLEIDYIRAYKRVP
jgi:beta-glucanase (GH16 family)